MANQELEQLRMEAIKGKDSLQDRKGIPEQNPAEKGENRRKCLDG